jgi:hypothetical protein
MIGLVTSHGDGKKTKPKTDQAIKQASVIKDKIDKNKAEKLYGMKFK